MSVDPREVAIITVHGNGAHYDASYARLYPWPRLQLNQLRRYTPPGYTVMAYGNGLIPEHEAILSCGREVELYLPHLPFHQPIPHRPWPLRNWLVRQAYRRFRYLVILDSDAFPVAADWLSYYIEALDADRPLVAVQRLENGDSFSAPCFMIFSSDTWREFRFDFSPVGVKDVGAAISNELETAGRDWHRLLRSNRWNPHPLTAGVYDHRIYHHGAGSRLPIYRMNQAIRDDKVTWFREVALHRGLLDLLFVEPQDLVQRLEGGREPLQTEELLARGEALIDQRPADPALP
jgi:hypothetical protein